MEKLPHKTTEQLARERGILYTDDKYMYVNVPKGRYWRAMSEGWIADAYDDGLYRMRKELSAVSKEKPQEEVNPSWGEVSP